MLWIKPNCGRIKGQRLYVGEGNIKSKDEIKIVDIPTNPAYKYYIASDGLFDQMGGEPSKSLGYKVFQKIILEYHDKSQNEISDIVWSAFEEYRGNELRVDDVELITFKP